MQLDIQVEQRGEGCLRLRVSGEVNIHTSPQLRDRLKPLLNAQTRELHVDLSGVDFMDSAGIATLVEGLQWSRASGGRFVLSGLTDSVRDVFALAKLDTVFDIQDAPQRQDA